MTAPVPAGALEANQRADACIAERRFRDSIPHAEAAVRLCPEWPLPHECLMVGYKHARRWEDALRSHDRLMQLGFDQMEGPNWNAGIAATALGLWDRARAAWAAAGVRLPPGRGPIEMPLGPTPVRVAIDDAPEVVWCDRIDPCRAWIRSVPVPASGRRFDDLVLHDGEPRGTRRLGAQMVSVFDELALIQPSSFGTWEVRVRSRDADELGRLLEELRSADLEVEDWTENVQVLCVACSLGSADGHAHDGHASGEAGWSTERRLGVAAHAEQELRPLRRFWGSWRPDVLSVQRVL